MDETQFSSALADASADPPSTEFTTDRIIAQGRRAARRRTRMRAGVAGLCALSVAVITPSVLTWDRSQVANLPLRPDGVTTVPSLRSSTVVVTPELDAHDVEAWQLIGQVRNSADRPSTRLALTIDVQNYYYQEQVSCGGPRDAELWFRVRFSTGSGASGRCVPPGERLPIYPAASPLIDPGSTFPAPRSITGRFQLLDDDPSKDCADNDTSYCTTPRAVEPEAYVPVEVFILEHSPPPVVSVGALPISGLAQIPRDREGDFDNYLLRKVAVAATDSTRLSLDLERSDHDRLVLAAIPQRESSTCDLIHDPVCQGELALRVDGNEQPEPEGFYPGGPSHLTTTAALVPAGEEHQVDVDMVTGDGRDHDLVLSVFELSPDLDAVFDR